MGYYLGLWDCHTIQGQLWAHRTLMGALIQQGFHRNVRAISIISFFGPVASTEDLWVRLS